MRRLWILALLLALGCSKETKPEIKYPERLPITEQAKELTELPEYQAPTEGGQTAGVSEGDTVKFDGILITEDKAMAGARLRISYDEVYRLAGSDRKYLLSVLEIQEKGLYRGDQIIDQKEAQLQKIRDSWWQRNKLGVGIGTGLILGIVVSVVTGKVWAEIEEGQQLEEGQQ